MRRVRQVSTMADTHQDVYDLNSFSLGSPAYPRKEFACNLAIIIGIKISLTLIAQPFFFFFWSAAPHTYNVHRPIGKDF
jgi:hypothetical protein